MMRKLLSLCLLLLLPAAALAATRGGTPLNPLEVSFADVFPIRVGGVTTGKGRGGYDGKDSVRSPVCSCPSLAGPRPGISVSYWEPSRLVEVVKDAYYFPTLATSMGGESRLGRGNGGIAPDETTTFAQAHYYAYPVMALLEVMTDIACSELSGFDLAWISEVDPTWNNDILATLLAPEALLFAASGPLGPLSCVPDAIASAANRPLDPLFWCMGGWGTTYPMSGRINNDNPVEASAALASKMTAKMSRQLLLPDLDANLCAPTPRPIWQKGDYKFQLLRPSTAARAIPVGRPGMLWTAGKNLPGGAKGPPDNYLYLLYRKRACCAF